MIKENIFGKFITRFIKFIENVKEKLENTLPDVLIEYGKNILKVIKNGLILCCVLIFLGLMAVSALGSIALIMSIITGSPDFQWYFAVSPVILILCIAGILTAEKDDQY